MIQPPDGVSTVPNAMGYFCIYKCGTMWTIFPTQEEYDRHFCPWRKENEVKLMKAAFPFKVGDKVRRSNWDWTEYYVTVTAVGVKGFLAENLELREEYFPISVTPGEWVLYVPPPVRSRWQFDTEYKEITPHCRYIIDGEIRIASPTVQQGVYGHVIISDVVEVTQAPGVPE